MSKIAFIDADSHIEEGPDMWVHLESQYHSRRPQIVDVSYEGAHRLRDKAWLIDGRLHPHNTGNGPVNHSSPATMTWARRKPVSIESQMLSPAKARLADMDKLGIVSQVNFPTIFLEHLSEDRGLEAALMRAWNRAMSEKSAEYPDRLKWAAMIPFWHTHAALEELDWAKANGAVAVCTLGTVYETLLNAPQFDPIYAKCEEVDLPVCVHIGWAHRGLNATCDSMLASIIFTFEQSVLHGFYAFLAGGILDRFRRLKVAFIEGHLGAYLTLLDRFDHYWKMATAQTPLAKRHPREYLEEGRVFFTTEGDEQELASAIRCFGARQVMMTADFPHVHYENASLANGILTLVANDQISRQDRDWVCMQSASRFYGIPLPTGHLDLGADRNAYSTESLQVAVS